MLTKVKLYFSLDIEIDIGLKAENFNPLAEILSNDILNWLNNHSNCEDETTAVHHHQHHHHHHQHHHHTNHNNQSQHHNIIAHEKTALSNKSIKNFYYKVLVAFTFVLLFI